MKKRFLMVLTIAVLMAAAVGCGNKAAFSAVVTPADGFDNAGYTEFECTETGNYIFEANDVSDKAGITWNVYVFDKPFEDAFRFIPQSGEFEAAISGSGGEMDIKKGQYYYVYCSENGFTLGGKDEITKGAELSIGMK